MKKRISLEETIINNKNSFLISALIFTPLILILFYVYYLNTNQSSESPSFLPLISSIIAFTGLWIASLSLLTNSIETRRKSSMDILFSLEKDLEFSKSKKLIMNERDLEVLFFQQSSVNDSIHNELVKLRDSFYYCSNIYEFLALSIRKNTIDEQIFTSLYRSRFLKFWGKIQPVIKEIRRNESKNTLFENIEWLADRYK